ncbi:hypothetical protein MFIFM68171_10193 [Madurella fahalii]|uniref:Uncharacterized protein n=1 Tax=Madurella fahalii TaxID=1157608 RepID=A0ABQ0GQH9_9PEZI
MNQQQPIFNIFAERLAVDKRGLCAVCNPDLDCPTQMVHPQCLAQLAPPEIAAVFAEEEAGEPYVFGPLDYDDSDEEEEPTSELPTQQADNVPAAAEPQTGQVAVVLWCSTCRKPTPNIEPGYKKCNKCRQKDHDRRESLKAQGKCNRCYKPIGKSNSLVLCSSCAKWRKAKDKARRPAKRSNK